MKNAVRKRRTWLGSSLLLLAVLGAGAGLAAWKRNSLAENAAAAAHVPEPMETITVATAAARQHRRTTTAIGTVVALRSITLHNELPGTVATVALEPGQVVAPGTVLVALDVSVEEAELRAQRAQATLAATMLERLQRANHKSAASAADVDKARAEFDVAQAQVARIEAIIAKKTIRAPFKSRVGMVDLHVGQYLREGTELTTLQGIDEAVHVDFTVTQAVALGLHPGESVDVLTTPAAPAAVARIEALDAHVDPSTRNRTVRARLEHGTEAPPPGAAVRVRVPVGAAREVVTVPVTALRKGPGGDHVFLVQEGADGRPRAHEVKVQGGPVLGDDVVILEGLDGGERVAAAGSFKLYESVLVHVAAAPQAEAGR